MKGNSLISVMVWPGKWWQRILLILVLYIALGSLVYINSFNNSFQYDDYIIVHENKNIQTLKNIPYFFMRPRMLSADPNIAGPHGGHYRPLVVTSYAINYAVSGLDPAGYHLVNLGFHAGSAFLLFLIVKFLLNGGNNPPLPPFIKGGMGGLSGAGFLSALAAGLIFLVHPFNSEAVNYITARSSVMSGFFYLMAFYCWMRFREVKGGGTGFYIASLLAFVAGMLSKEVVITLPIVLWLYDMYFNRSYILPAIEGNVVTTRHTSFFTSFLSWRTYVVYLPFILAVAIPYLAMRAFSLGRMLPGFKRDIWTQLFTELPVLVKQWQMFIIPGSLTPFHYVEVYKSFWVFPVIFSGVIVSVLIGAGIFLVRLSGVFSRVVSFFIFWFFIVLLPTTIIPLNAILQENRGYLAVVSFAVICGMVIGFFRRRVMWGGVAILLILLILYSVVTVQRNRVWRDELTLWEDAVKKAPGSPEVYIALGVSYRRAGMYSQALEASRKALDLGGADNFVVHDNIGRVYMVQEKWELAAKALERSILAYPNKAETHSDIGAAYYKMGELDKAEKEYIEAIRLDPQSYAPYFNLGVLYTRQGRLEDAMIAYKKALSVSPEDTRTRLHIGILLDNMGKRKEAAKYFQQVIKDAVAGEEELLQEAKRRIENYRERDR